MYRPKKGTVTLVYYNKYNNSNVYNQKEIQLQVMSQPYSFVFNGQKEGFNLTITLRTLMVCSSL